MSEARQVVQEFLMGWKPFAQLPPGNPARRSLTRFIETDDPTQREEIFARLNLLYRLHKTYVELGMRREDNSGIGEQHQRLMRMKVEDMAEAISSGGRRDLAELLQAGFEFGRSVLEPRLMAVRLFLLEFWDLPVGGLGMKYSVYPNGVLFSIVGLTHDELARRFNDLGMGQGAPLGGGEIQRQGDLEFLFDTASTAFKGAFKPEFVQESLKRWVRLTGGSEDRVTFSYRERMEV